MTTENPRQQGDHVQLPLARGTLRVTAIGGKPLADDGCEHNLHGRSAAVFRLPGPEGDLFVWADLDVLANGSWLDLAVACSLEDLERQLLEHEAESNHPREARELDAADRAALARAREALA